FGSTDNATIRTARWFRAESENAGVGSTDSRYYPKLSHGRNDGCAPKCGVWQQHSTGDPHQTAHDLGDAPGLSDTAARGERRLGIDDSLTDPTLPSTSWSPNRRTKSRASSRESGCTTSARPALRAKR